MAIRRREVEDLVREAEQKGWRVRKGGHGRVLQCPHDCACQVSVASTPSAHRSGLNTRAVLRRCKGWAPP